MSKKKPEVKILFGLDGKSGVAIDLGELTRRIGITPTETRGLDDWPDAVKNPKVELPENLGARCCWAVTLDYEECFVVSDRLDQLINILRGKESVINSLRQKLHLEAYFVVIVAAHRDRTPAMCLTKENVEFIASIGAEVSFDMYLD
jgi:hypothetical protein